jgi:hypothetical protein
MLKITLNFSTNEAKILNKQVEVLKEGAILAFTDSQIYQNHFVINKKSIGKFDNNKIKNVINHRIRGVKNIQSVKKGPKLMDYLKKNNICISKNNWQEEEWVLHVIGFSTHIVLSAMSLDYSTKIVRKDLKRPVKFKTVLKFQIISIRVRLSHKKKSKIMNVYGIKVTTQNVKDMLSILEPSPLFSDLPIVVKTDNIGAIFMLESDSFCTYHVGTRYNFVWEVIEDGFIEIEFVCSAENDSHLFYQKY